MLKQNRGTKDVSYEYTQNVGKDPKKAPPMEIKEETRDDKTRLRIKRRSDKVRRVCLPALGVGMRCRKERKPNEQCKSRAHSKPMYNTCI